MTVDRGTIDQQLRSLHEGEHWWEQREFRELPNLLYPDERMYGLIRGKVLGRLPKVRPTRKWLIVVTNRRVILLKHGSFASKQVVIFPDMVTRVYHAGRLRTYQITIVTTVEKYRIRIPKVDAFRFVQALASVIPSESVHQLSPSLEALSWVPGIATVAALPGVERMLSRTNVLSAPQHAMKRDFERLEETVESLQNEVDKLVEQVAFLESLLQKRAHDAALSESIADS
jgi:hypothetical protein